MAKGCARRGMIMIGSTLGQRSRSPSKGQFPFEDGVNNVLDMNYPPVEPMRLPQKKMQNDYIHEWLPQKEDFLRILLDLEAPPLPHICKICGKDGVVQQWTGDFFKDSALHMMCKPPSVDTHIGTKYLTVIDVTGVHFMLSQPCQCVNAESYHKQLLCAKLYPSTIEKPSTAFTFLVLDDFLRDNVECGTSGMNYYSKLCRVTSSMFPHLVADQYQELLWVAWQWHLLKLLKWSGYQDNMNGSTKGDLALFCVACPQPSINLSAKANLDDWRYTRTVVWLMDGHGFMVTNLQYWEYIEATPHITEKSACNNHKAISQASASHRKLNSTGMGATACAWHGCFYLHSVVDFQKGERWVDNTKFLEIAPPLRIVVGIRMWHVHRHKKECYARYSPLFIKGSGWVDGKIIETLWSTLNIAAASTCSMTSPHCQELLDFQMNNSNFMKMIHMSSSLLQKLKVARLAVSLAREAFERLNDAATSSQLESWRREEEAALKDCVHDPSVMDIFEIQLMKVPDHGSAPTVHGVELHLLQTSATSGMHHGAASWLTHGLAIEEVDIALAISHKAIRPNPSDLKVAAEQTAFIADGRIYLWMDTTLDDSEEFDRSHEVASKNILVDDDISSNGGNSNCSADDMPDMDTFAELTSPPLPLPSNLGADRCCDIGIHQLVEMELELHIAQANDALHGLCLALADKAIIFRGVVRTAMIALRASPEILNRYQELQKAHLTTSTAAFTQGGHDHRASQLPWFWSIDIPRDTSSKSWLTEFYRIHWLHAKAAKDHWEEEEELLTLEFQWVINYF
ncbi:hypothetical protein EDC04DRAFT_2612685 [Pisolithus marmoratus]|nr:hypothetical protein EDC04DRAFT_2612685 [Pisolithus marmoratus]